MESVFGWLGQIFEALLSCFPRRIIVEPVYQLVKVKWDGSVEAKGAGVRWYFPLLTSAELVAVERQSLDDIKKIHFLSEEGIPFFADAACIYTVTDVILFSTKNYDTLDTIRESLSASIFTLLSGKPFEALRDMDKINQEITSAVDIDLEGFGIELEMVRLSSLCWIIPVM
jgi:hypothetical protein